MSRWDAFKPHDQGKSDDYRIVTAKVLRKKDEAILIAVKQGEAWVPRSLLHGADDMALALIPNNSEWTFRLREWKAEELGLA